MDAQGIMKAMRSCSECDRLRRQRDELLAAAKSYRTRTQELLRRLDGIPIVSSYDSMNMKAADKAIAAAEQEKQEKP